MIRALRRQLRFLAELLVALLPSFLKIPCYRCFFRYEIGTGVRIGWSPLIGIPRCRIGDHVRIGHGNLFCHVEEITIGAHTSIGFLNVFRGGQRIELGPYTHILRKNVFNAILEPECVEPFESVLTLGCGSVVTSGHWLDFSDGIALGDQVIIGGRNSSLWTHNRQRGRSITIGHHCYLGSEIRVAPGVELAPLCIVALGAVLTGQHAEPCALVGGNPAVFLRKLRESEYTLVGRKTRADIPNELAEALLPAEIRAAVRAEMTRATLPADREVTA
jgi:acetyltransferase-like isoleucine patch superfamily enzyme